MPSGGCLIYVLAYSIVCLLFAEPTCKASDVVNAVAKLSKAKHLLKVDDLPG